jgi:hypothetical protein
MTYGAVTESAFGPQKITRAAIGTYLSFFCRRGRGPALVSRRHSMSESALSVRLVRYDVKKLRWGQLFAPVTGIATVAARRLPGPVSLTVAVASLTLALFAFVTARRGFGRRALVLEGRCLRFGAHAPEIRPASVTSWTWDAPTARLYGAELSWRLATDNANADGVRAALTTAFGKPKLLSRRGSARARGIAFAVLLAGAATTGAGIGFQLTACAVLGVLGLIGGMAAFGAQSQKVVGRRDENESRTRL